MQKLLRCLAAAAVLAILPVAGVKTAAQTRGSAGNKALDKAAYDSLRDVINHGADLFNNYGDYAGCYQAYRAGLIAVRPFLAHHPDLQKVIDDGVAGAEEHRRVVARAFALRRVLGNLREQVEKRSGPFTEVARIPAPKKQREKAAAKKAETPKTLTKKGEKTGKKTMKMTGGAAALARLSGKVSYKGKPVTGGWYVTLVSSRDKHSFSTHIHADGGYSFKTPIPPGTYTIAIEQGPREPAKAARGKGAPSKAAQPVVIPERYRNPVTSGLTIELKAGTHARDLNLQ